MKRVARLFCLITCLIAALVGGGIWTDPSLSVAWLVPVALLFGFYSCPIGSRADDHLSL